MTTVVLKCKFNSIVVYRHWRTVLQTRKTCFYHSIFYWNNTIFSVYKKVRNLIETQVLDFNVFETLHIEFSYNWIPHGKHNWLLYFRWCKMMVSQTHNFTIAYYSIVFLKLQNYGCYLRIQNGVTLYTNAHYRPRVTIWYLSLYFCTF